MRPQIKVNRESQVPVYKQIIESIKDLTNSGKLKTGDFLPSMRELSEELQISKETVKKAYSILRDNGIIESTQGKGYYVTNNGSDRIKILVLFDKISTYKQELFSSFQESMGESSEITIRLHNKDIDLFEYFVEENLDKFDYFLITPHFPLIADIQKRAVKILKKIPNRKLLLIDRYIKELTGNFGSVYQDFERDVFDGLSQGLDTLRKYKKLNVMNMPGSTYAPLIEKGIKDFCTKNKINFEIHKLLNPDLIISNEAYLILNSQLDKELIELARIAKIKGCKIGEEIGIISYNESPINEIVLDGLTVLSTDFRKMGELAARMILEKSFRKIRCDFKLIRRSTF